MHRSGLLVLGILSAVAASAQPHGCAVSSSQRGTFIAEKPKGFQPNTLRLDPSKDGDTIRFDLQAYWSPKPNDDGSATTQGIFTGEMAVRWCVGHHVSEDRECYLVFNFQPDTVRVTSFGQCSHGHNAYPDATYRKTRRKAGAP